jgi:hypothetical protein
VSITKNTTDKLILWFAILGVLEGLTFTALVGATFLGLNFRMSWWDELFLFLLSCAGVYSL